MPVFVNEARIAKRRQHLIDVTGGEPFLRSLPCRGYDFLHGELHIAVWQVRDYSQKVSLPVRGARPSASKKIVVKFLNDLFRWNRRIYAGTQSLNPRVKNFTANELDEIGITA